MAEGGARWRICLARVLRAERPEIPLEVINDELEAVSIALQRLQPGEVLVAFCDRVSDVVATIRSLGAEPVSTFSPLDHAIEASAA